MKRNKIFGRHCPTCSKALHSKEIATLAETKSLNCPHCRDWIYIDGNCHIQSLRHNAKEFYENKKQKGAHSLISKSAKS